jgi:hypothetical protein
VGTVATATSATTAGSATTATTAGTVTTAAQPAITSVGSLLGLTVHKDGQYTIPGDNTSLIWDPDLVSITGYHGATHGIYFTSLTNGFTMLSDTNADFIAYPYMEGSGLGVNDKDNKVTIWNGGYQTTTVDAVGSVVPGTTASQNLGAKAGSIASLDIISGTPAAAKTFAESWIVSQSSPTGELNPLVATSGSGADASFEVYTTPASVGGQVYKVRINALGSGYASINKTFVNTTGISLVVNDISGITQQMAVTGAGFTSGQRVVTIDSLTNTLTLTAAADSTTSSGSTLTFNDTVTIFGSALNGTDGVNDLILAVVPTLDLHWKNLYVSDVTMKNEANTWTMMPGSDGLYIINNSTGAKFKITMTSVPTGGPNPIGV